MFRDPSKLETELRPLKNTKDFFKKIIISKTSMKSWTDEDGILHLGLYEFLLNVNSSNCKLNRLNVNSCGKPKNKNV